MGLADAASSRPGGSSVDRSCVGMAARLRRSAPRSSAVLVLALATLVAAGPAYSADTSYLKEMPSPERVLREIKGTDAKDTAARQAAAVTWLIRMMNARI